VVNTGEYDAFISYSSRERVWVNQNLLHPLESASLKICVDYRDFDVGVPSLINMEQAIERSRKTLLVITPSWIQSQWTQFECLLAQVQDPAARGQRLLPLLVEKTELPRRLSMLTYLDFTDPSAIGFQRERLIKAIKPSEPEVVDNVQNQTIANSGNSVARSSIGRYTRALEMLRELIRDKDFDIVLAQATLAERLRDNLSDEGIYGTSEVIRAERARILHELNRLALQHAGKTFNDLTNS